MAFNAGSVLGKLKLDTKNFVAGISKAVKSVNRFTRAGKAARSGLRSLRGGLGSTTTKLLATVAALVAINKGFRALKGAVVTASRASADYESKVRRLSVALKLAGSNNVRGMTEELEKFAAATQDATKFSDVQVLETAQLLKTMNVADNKLEEYTKTVLDFAAAVGRDPVEVGKQFVRTLSGMTGELGEIFPAVRALTPEVLKMGGAFDTARMQLGGFAEKSAEDTQGALIQLGNAWTDLLKEIGFAVNEYLKPFAKTLKAIVKDLTSQLQSAAGAAALRRGVELAFNGIAIAIRFAVDLVLRFKTVIAALPAVFPLLESAALGVWGRVQNAIAGTLEGIASALDPILSGFAAAFDFFGADAAAEKLRGAVRTLKDYAQGWREGAEETKASQAALEGVIGKIRDAAFQSEAYRAAVLAGGEELRGFDAILGRLANLQGQIKREARGTADAWDDVGNSAGGAARAAQGVVGVWRDAAKWADENVQNARALGDAANNAGGAIGGAADEASRLADNLGRAASGASAVASASGGGGGGGPPTLSASRTTVSRSSIDFSDPFRAAALARNAQETLGRVSRGGRNVFVGNAGVRAARAFADSVTAEANASIERFIADFTASVVQELNSLGVLDPAERSRVIQQRINEAQRLGIIPERVGTLTQGLA